MKSKICGKITKKYYCKSCHYCTSKLSSWKKHLNTKKHNRNKTETKKLPEEFVCDCGKNYKSRSGLYKHKLSCKKIVEEKKKDDVCMNHVFLLNFTF